MERGDDMRKALAWIIVALLVAVPLAGVGVFSWVQAQDPETLAPKPVAILQQPTTVNDDGAMDGTITATLTPGIQVTAPAWQGGVVTRVDVKPGDTVSTGGVLLAIDGIGRMAIASPAPFYRMLTVGDSGDDVLNLEQALKTIGDFAGTPNRDYNETTAAAVRKLEKKLGVGAPTGVFDPLWAVWLPAEGLTAQTVHVAVNAAAPTQGSAVFATAPSIASIKLSGPAGPVDFASGAYVLAQNGADVAVIHGDGDVNADLLGKLTAQDSGTAGGASGGGSMSSGGSGSAESSAAPRTYTVNLRREQATTLLSVPSSAVMTGEDGTTVCVYGKYGREDADYQAKTVTVAGGSLGATHIQPADDLKSFYVLADPLAVMQETPTCR